MRATKKRRARSAPPTPNQGAARGARHRKPAPARRRNSTINRRPEGVPRNYDVVSIRTKATDAEDVLNALAAAGIPSAIKPYQVTSIAGTSTKYAVWTPRKTYRRAVKLAEGAWFKRHPNAHRNPDDEDTQAAADLSEKFHGRPARKISEIEELEQETDTYAELGDLKEFHVITRAGGVYVLHFGRGVKLASTPDGGQLAVIGGDQAINLADLDLNKHLPKANLTMGELWKVVYKTRKGFHNFEAAEYIHEFGEDRGGELPILGYDTANQRLYIEGGSYEVRPEGIVN